MPSLHSSRGANGKNSRKQRKTSKSSQESEEHDDTEQKEKEKETPKDTKEVVEQSQQSNKKESKVQTNKRKRPIDADSEKEGKTKAPSTRAKRGEKVVEPKSETTEAQRENDQLVEIVLTENQNGESEKQQQTTQIHADDNEEGNALFFPAGIELFSSTILQYAVS